MKKDNGPNPPFFNGYLLILAVVLLLGGCNEFDEPDDTYLGYDYFPVEVGKYNIYEVEEIQYFVSGFDTAKYFLRETVFDSTLTDRGIEYLVRSEVTSGVDLPWEADSIFAILVAPSFLATKKNNRWKLELAFPVRKGKNWDANSLNSLSPANRYYEEVQELVIDSISIGDHISVVLANIEQNVTGIDLRSEIFARGVGLVRRQYFTQTTCTASDCGDDLGAVIAGRFLRQELLETGYEEE